MTNKYELSIEDIYSQLRALDWTVVNRENDCMPDSLGYVYPSCDAFMLLVIKTLTSEVLSIWTNKKCSLLLSIWLSSLLPSASIIFIFSVAAWTIQDSVQELEDLRSHTGYGESFIVVLDNVFSSMNDLWIPRYFETKQQISGYLRRAIPRR